MPDYEAKLYVASQAMDEARHVEVFARYIRKLDKIYPVQPGLGRARRHHGDAPHWQSKMVGMQVILEGLALGTFINVRGRHGLRAAALAPRLRDARTRRATSPSATSTSPTEIARMHADDRAAVEDFACETMKKMVAMRRGMEGMAGFEDVLVESGIDRGGLPRRRCSAEVAAGFQLERDAGKRAYAQVAHHAGHRARAAW